MSGEYQASLILVFKAEKRKPRARDIGQDGGLTVPSPRPMAPCGWASSGRGDGEV